MFGLLFAALLAGCSAQQSADTPDADPSPPPGQSHVVVADIDSGINVYHDRFRRDGGIPDEVLTLFVDATTEQPPVRVQLTMDGSFQERYEADEKIWDNLTQETLYYFEGTSVLGISFTGSGDVNPVLDFPNGSHGTATSGAVLDANPEAIIVLVEGVGDGEGELWAMAQPWIDVTTMSYGPIGSPPTSSQEETGTHAATHVGWRNGKVPVGAADNTPSPAPNDQTAGPPWVLGVAGDHIETQCRDHVSGTFPDYTANFTQTLPDADSVDGRSSTSGTSFATPTTAGTASKIILDVRKAWNHTGGIQDGALAVSPTGQRMTNADVREAMNETAYYFDTASCEPGLTSFPVNPAAPYLQMGWGHVGPEIVDAAVARLLGGGGAPRDAGAVAFQEALYQYRVQLWGQP